MQATAASRFCFPWCCFLCCFLLTDGRAREGREAAVVPCSRVEERRESQESEEEGFREWQRRSKETPVVSFCVAVSMWLEETANCGRAEEGGPRQRFSAAIFASDVFVSSPLPPALAPFLLRIQRQPAGTGTPPRGSAVPEASGRPRSWWPATAPTRAPLPSPIETGGTGKEQQTCTIPPSSSSSLFFSWVSRMGTARGSTLSMRRTSTSTRRRTSTLRTLSEGGFIKRYNKFLGFFWVPPTALI